MTSIDLNLSELADLDLQNQSPNLQCLNFLEWWNGWWLTIWPTMADPNHQLHLFQCTQNWLMLDRDQIQFRSAVYTVAELI